MQVNGEGCVRKDIGLIFDVIPPQVLLQQRSQLHPKPPEKKRRRRKG